MLNHGRMKQIASSSAAFVISIRVLLVETHTACLCDFTDAVGVRISARLQSIWVSASGRVERLPRVATYLSQRRPRPGFGCGYRSLMRA
jgi:hypothetical protein